MSRRTFGGRSETVIQDSAGNVLADWPVQVYDAREGTQVTDLREINGDPIAELKTQPSTAADAGRIRRFRGPDGVSSLWYRLLDSQSREVWWPDFCHEAADTAFAAQTAAATAQAAAEAAQSDIDDLSSSDMLAKRVEVPSIEDVFTATLLVSEDTGTGLFTVANGAAFAYCFTAPYPLYVMSADICPVRDIAASGSAYWTATLHKTAADIASIDSQDGWSKYTAVSFDDDNFDPTNRVLSQGESLWIQFVPTGSPATLIVGATVRYARADS